MSKSAGRSSSATAWPTTDSLTTNSMIDPPVDSLRFRTGGAADRSFRSAARIARVDRRKTRRCWWRPILPVWPNCSRAKQALIDRLQICQQQRAALLERCERAGLSSSLAGRVDQASASSAATALVSPKFAMPGARARLLQHQSLTNWVFVQRTLIHLSQMLEIIATGGRLRPTYGKGDTADTSGNLVDQEA